ncbi:hypothetical protein QQS21_004722 [Conoideocrella luteorostrata]|uniref:Uncharacterized protein n=1 Tax=Conoideocrella luteorostrata TaxID=1105319 RepID=A0AAJ0CTU9_9HYPO|nr:hypothetical protein QQS21_004722 [Conoideocrella luteorostrata]
MATSEGLEPPPNMNKADPGAHHLSEPESSDSDDQFTDAQSAPMTPHISSPIPKTRVEKVDSSPSHGEVPGTEAYKMRESDAQPDEIAVAKDSENSITPTATPTQEIPMTVLDPVWSDDDRPSPKGFSSVDAKPDITLELESDTGEDSVDADQDDEFGDDFDDFEGGHDDDFDDFQDGFQQPQPTAAASQRPPPVQPYQLPFSIPDFDGLGADEILSATEPCLDNLFPPEELVSPPPQILHKESSMFLTPRSASLWSQLVAPPPLAPPDWIRSRTRRLFLVSLGVPVDLDEILPASKQKKLILPSLNLRAHSPRTSSDSRSASRLRQGEGNVSSTSVDTQGKPTGSKKRKGPPPEPELDLVAARYLCMTTDEALDGMTNEELKEHVSKLEAMQGTAKEVLEYWRKRTDEKIGDREAFEGVIENLVKHARKVRK